MELSARGRMMGPSQCSSLQLTASKPRSAHFDQVGYVRGVLVSIPVVYRPCMSLIKVVTLLLHCSGSSLVENTDSNALPEASLCQKNEYWNLSPRVAIRTETSENSKGSQASSSSTRRMCSISLRTADKPPTVAPDLSSARLAETWTSLASPAGFFSFLFVTVGVGSSGSGGGPSSESESFPPPRLLFRDKASR